MFDLRFYRFARTIVYSLICSIILIGCSRGGGGDTEGTSARGKGSYDNTYDPLGYDDTDTGSLNGSSNPFSTSGDSDVSSNGKVDQGAMTDLMGLMNALSADKKQQVQFLVLDSVDKCNFLSGPKDPNARTKCKNGDAKGCAGMITNLGKDYMGSLVDNGNFEDDNIPALIAQQKNMCANIDWKNPKKVQSELEKLRNQCVNEHNLGSCIGMLLMAVAMFVQGILGAVLGGAIGGAK